MNALFTMPPPSHREAMRGAVDIAEQDPDSQSLLQHILFPTSPTNIDLYVRKLHGELLFGDTLSTYGPAFLSFNTYFNSFYESYWTGHTSLEEVSLVVQGSGRFWCNIFRESKSQGLSLAARVFVELDELRSPQVVIPVRLITKGHGHGGRLFVDLESLTPVNLERMAWTTRQAPRQPVALGVGICTFNREEFVTRTIRQLVCAEPEAAVAKIVVANQGSALLSPLFQTTLAQAGDRLHLVEQGNFGGAGGFTRCAIELLDSNEVTHVLFMDDDIDLDVRHLATTAAFLRYATHPIIVGGHMLDLYRRNILYEAGNSISPDNQLRPNHHDLDLNQLSSLTALSRASPAHFNGWWYAAIPLSCFKDFGLPAPVFIRGDDMEYGTRLHRAGVETVSLAPVSVWHEPFYAKAPGWQLYYDLRNRLIMASFNDDLFALESPSRLLKLLMVHLIRYDYQHAWFMMQAICDFLKGPALLEEGLPAIHQRITRDSAALAPVKMRAALGLAAAPVDVPQEPKRIRRRMMASLLRVMTGRIRRQPFGVLYTDTPLQWVRLGESYVLSDREGHFFLRYSYSKSETWRLLKQTTAALLKYDRTRGAAARAWKAAHPRLVSMENWRSILGLSPAVVSAPKS